VHPTYNIEVMDVTGNVIDYTVHMCTIQAKIDADKESKEGAPPAHASVGAGGHMPGAPLPGLPLQGQGGGKRYAPPRRCNRFAFSARLRAATRTS